MRDRIFFRKIVFFTILVGYTLSSHSQSLYSLTIIDRDSKENIPYASLSTDKRTLLGYSDEKGKAKFLLNARDTLYIFCTGYQMREIPISALKTEASIWLIPQEYSLDTVKIVSGNNTEFVTMGYKEAKHTHSSGTSHGSEIAVFIPNKLKKTCKLAYVHYKIDFPNWGKDDFKVGLIGLRLYMRNGQTKMPDLNITPKNFLLSAKKGKVLTFDLRDFDIIVPDDGFFVSFEKIDSELSYQNAHLTTPLKGILPGIQMSEKGLNIESFERENAFFISGWKKLDESHPRCKLSNSKCLYPICWIEVTEIK